MLDIMSRVQLVNELIRLEVHFGACLADELGRSSGLTRAAHQTRVLTEKESYLTCTSNHFIQRGMQRTAGRAKPAKNGGVHCAESPLSMIPTIPWATAFGDKVGIKL